MINWNKLPNLPGMADTASLGVSAPFTGISNGMLLVAGGCNFPDKPVTEGGTKKYYSDIFALNLSNPASGWKKAGNLPFPVAYGATVTTPDGIICIGGNNSDTFFPDVCLLSWNTTDEKAEINTLPSLPAPMDNLSATYTDHTVYVAGGNKNTLPCNSFLSMDLTAGSNWVNLPDFRPVCFSSPKVSRRCTYLSGRRFPAHSERYGSDRTSRYALVPSGNKNVENGSRTAFIQRWKTSHLHRRLCSLL